MKVYIYENEFWPNFTWNDQELIELLGKVRNLQGRIVGKMESLGFNLKQQAELETLKTEILRSSEIEGEILNPEQVRSSIARKLGMDISGLIPSDRNVEGIVDMMLDATQNFSQPLTKERVFDWHYALFPTGRSGMYKVIVGNWRNDSTGPMQVISGPMGKEKVHFQAPAATLIDEEMNSFLDWFNNYEKIDLVLKAGIAHLWFVTIHPFEDGNGRIARTISDMLLARADGISQRFYSMSAQIRQERKEYYEILEKTQKGDLNITKWLTWFLNCLLNALNESNIILEKVINKHNFWIENALKIQNGRQKLMLNKILDGDFFGKLTSSKWAKITKCSPDTALRDIQDLIDKGILKKAEEGGRSTNYELIE
ncbi:Fic family protein [Prolixibacter sp. SD074]|uniref:Fic family protein n=1 Tax=Prolixibacter sp. SD074 TaxID=2652391 RepID=UPI001285982B|nr:Fic family protein [Prolixibacter sp. SD074]GET28211.1 cell division protein Fic [Prolixibacter sp. SD074]